MPGPSPAAPPGIAPRTPAGSRCPFSRISRSRQPGPGCCISTSRWLSPISHPDSGFRTARRVRARHLAFVIEWRHRCFAAGFRRGRRPLPPRVPRLHASCGRNRHRAEGLHGRCLPCLPPRWPILALPLPFERNAGLVGAPIRRTLLASWCRCVAHACPADFGHEDTADIGPTMSRGSPSPYSDDLTSRTWPVIGLAQIQPQRWALSPLARGSALVYRVTPGGLSCELAGGARAPLFGVSRWQLISTRYFSAECFQSAAHTGDRWVEAC